MLKERVAVLFSGGIDSTAAAVYYLAKGDRVFLVTFDNGAETNLENSQSSAKNLIKRFGRRCSWDLLDSKELFHGLSIKGLEADVKKYGNLICCGCKLAMLAHTILFCRDNDIGIVADGFEKGQTYYPEQHPDYIRLAGLFAEEFGIDYQHPVYMLSPGEIKKMVADSGIKSDFAQASCLFGFNRVRNSNIKRYTQEKISRLRRFLKRNIKGGYKKPLPK